MAHPSPPPTSSPLRSAAAVTGAGEAAGVDAAPASAGAGDGTPAARARPSLAARLPRPGAAGSRRAMAPEEILDSFVEWTADAGFALYRAQEEALLEIAAGRHVILNTPTGSGKSLVALGLHWKALCEGRTSFYTSPIKALASEKFFSLCDDFGAENVGMLTGDAAINPRAPIVCCTAEVLANMALRRGEELDAPYVVMDEFHYYSDPERGVAWQIPLLTLARTRFLLMSATLGDMTAIAERLQARTGVEVALVTSAERPVPLDFEYRETPLHQTIEDLLVAGKAPIYVVNFTQRECAELAQSLTSLKIASREERERIRETIGGARLDTPYGKEFRRFLSFGIGVHHAGLLPKYRLLVEQLAQQGLLRVICGTDTLGVGVNIPIRTVLFSRLAKFDGRKVAMLSVRDFQQIAGRAGRKGFDVRGSVVAQAPEHIVEKRLAERRADEGKKRRRPAAAAPKGEVSWSKETFEKLVSRPPETLKSRFRITHGMVLNLLQRDAERDDPARRNFDSLRELIARSHEDEASKRRLLGQAAMLVRSLYRAGVIHLVRDTAGRYLWVVVDAELQWDFSLHQALSLFLVEALGLLDEQAESYAADVVSLVEAVLEDPEVVLRRQVDKLKQELVAQLKADGVPYEERMEKLEEVGPPQPPAPLADLLHGAFHRFRGDHPWVGGRDLRTKSIGREMLLGYLAFGDFVKRYGLERSEGVLLRYLSQLYKTLKQSVPEAARTEAVFDALGFFRALLERTDSSLLEEWEELLHPEIRRAAREREREAAEALWIRELVADPRAFAARVRAEMHLLVRTLAARDWEAAAESVRAAAGAAGDGGPPAAATEGAGANAPGGGDGAAWDAERFERELAPFFAEYGELVFTPEARRHQLTHIRRTGDRTWEASQTLLDPQGDNLWAIEGEIDLRDPHALEGPLVRLRRIGP